MEYVGGQQTQVKRPDYPRVCTECGSEEVEHSGEEFYCKKCGLVLD